MWIYRDTNHTLDGAAALRRLRAAVEREAPEDALLLAGELECALADANHPRRDAFASVTLAIAGAYLAERRLSEAVHPFCCDLDGRFRVSRPEGFAYYAMHPLDYAEAVRTLSCERRRVVVVGLRSIGTTLSAVVCAALEARGNTATRFTVRPSGAPFDRRVILDECQKDHVRAAMDEHGLFLVVDEGPGLSGSSFLAAAEALTELGVPRERVRLVPSHRPNLDSLVAPRAKDRWSAFSMVVAESTRARPEGLVEDWSGGAWRTFCSLPPRAWPGVWPMTERRKYVDRRRSVLFKFEGLGPYGREPRRRAEALAAAGWGPAVRGESSGYLAYEFCAGRRLRLSDVNEERIAHAARYLAFRNEVMKASDPTPELPAMVAANLEGLCDLERLYDLERLCDLEKLRSVTASVELPVERCVVPDGKMSLHEWVFDGTSIRKTDAVGHGDDHFFPGPCDVAWDLAGTVVEWQLPPAGAEYLVELYSRISGDRSARARFDEWLLAYRTFRAAWLAMARDNVANADERARLGSELTSVTSAWETGLGRSRPAAE